METIPQREISLRFDKWKPASPPLTLFSISADVEYNYLHMTVTSLVAVAAPRTGKIIIKTASMFLKD